MSIDIRRFNQEFNKEYEFMYEASMRNETVAGYDEAVRAFDEFAPKHKAFVMEFVKYRGDFISSDREAAAFMFALCNVA